MTSRRHTRGAVERVPVPHPGIWSAGGATLLLAALLVFRAGVPSGAGPPWFALPRWVHETANFIAYYVPVDRHVTLRIAIASVLLLAALWAIRRMLFARLARRPGAIELQSVVDATDGQATPGEPSIADVTAHLRQALNQMSLSSPMPVPGAAAPQSFVDNVRTAASQAAGPLAVVAGLLGALNVTSAYRVSVVIRRRDDEQSRYGISVQVTTLPSGTTEGKTFYDKDWYLAADRAAHFAAAYVLPRTRLCARPPWTSWQGIKIPDDLFYTHQRAQRHLENREHEKALELLFSALDRDPRNPYIRIEILQVYEQLGLYLDALAGYADVISVESWRDRKLWCRLNQLRDKVKVAKPPRSFWPLLMSHADAQPLLLARYRLICTLASAGRLAAHWQRTDSDNVNPLRKRERDRQKWRVRRWLRRYYVQFRECYAEAGLAEEFDEFTADRRSLQRLLQFVAMNESYHFVADYSWLRRRRRPGLPVTQTAARILNVWAPLYLHQSDLLARVTAERAQDAQLCMHKSMKRFRRRLRKSKCEWPPAPDRLEALVAGRMRGKPMRLREWQEHYNAACVFAVSLNDPFIELDVDEARERRRNLARKAVRNLELAVSATDSGGTARHAQWLTTGDPDLRELRATTTFSDFADRYFPGITEREVWPEDILYLLLSGHMVDLMWRYAEQRASFYEREANRGALKDELAREPGIANLVEAYTRNHRHWPTRLELIKEAERFARDRDAHGFGSGLPTFSIDPARHMLGNLGRNHHHGADPHEEIQFREEIEQESNLIIRQRDAIWARMTPLSRPSLRRARRYWRRYANELSLLHDPAAR